MHQFSVGDLVIVEPRSDASTGEKVIAQDGNGRIYIGNWWTKHRARELHIDPARKPMRKVSIMGVINHVVHL